MIHMVRMLMLTSLHWFIRFSIVTIDQNSCTLQPGDAWQPLPPTPFPSAPHTSTVFIPEVLFGILSTHHKHTRTTGPGLFNSWSFLTLSTLMVLMVIHSVSSVFPTFVGLCCSVTQLSFRISSFQFILQS